VYAILCIQDKLLKEIKCDIPHIPKNNKLFCRTIHKPFKIVYNLIIFINSLLKLVHSGERHWKKVSVKIKKVAGHFLNNVTLE
jgi:hypothetical protein